MPADGAILTLPCPVERERRQVALCECFIVYRKIPESRHKHSPRPPVAIRRTLATRESHSRLLRCSAALASWNRVSLRPAGGASQRDNECQCRFFCFASTSPAHRGPAIAGFG